MMKITNGIVIQLYWKDIQPQENAAISRNNKVNNAVSWVRKFKTKHGIEIPIKIRLYNGIFSPSWLMEKGYFVLNENKVPNLDKPEPKRKEIKS